MYSVYNSVDNKNNGLCQRFPEETFLGGFQKTVFKNKLIFMKRGRTAYSGSNALGGCSGSRGIWGYLWFSCGVAHGGGGLISVFQGLSASAGGAFILAGGMGAGLSFYGI